MPTAAVRADDAASRGRIATLRARAIGRWRRAGRSPGARSGRIDSHEPPVGPEPEPSTASIALCAVCGGCARRELGTLGHRELAACAACGHRFARRWDAARLAAEYRAAYYAHAEDPRIASWAQQHRAEWAAVVAQIRRLHPNASSLLDVGAGSGGFVQVVHDLQPAWHVAALEPSLEARSSLRARMPWLALFEQPVETLAALPERFDVITILQTLEHLADPAAAVRAAHACLLPGGLLFVTVPNRRALDVLRRGLTADCYANHTHLQFFDRRGLWRLLVDGGFERVQRLTDFGGGPRRAWWFALAQYGARLLGVSSELRMVAFRPPV